MTMIKCSECGKEISDKADRCINCGAPILIAAEDGKSTQANSKFGDLNGDGKVDFEDFKKALTSSKEYAKEKVEDAVKFAKEKLRSKKERDDNAVKEMPKDFSKILPLVQTESLANRDKFKAALESTIDVKVADILRLKKDSESYLTYVDAQILTSSVRNIFKMSLSVTPFQVNAALMLSEAILAPTTKEKENLIKAVFALTGTGAGVGIVIVGIGSALGWGAGLVATVTAAIMGSPVGGHVGVIVSGLVIAGIAGYFASTSNNQTDTERFIRVLKSSTACAVDSIWEQYEKELSKTVAQATSEGADGSK